MTSQDVSIVVASVAPVIRAFYEVQIAGLKALLDEERATMLGMVAGLEQRLARAEQRTMLPGPKGDPGANGADGKDGIAGLNGKDGAPGLNGKDGIAGLNGKDGIDGRHGIDGKDGAAGVNGKDGNAALNGKDGADGLAGKDGIGLNDAVIDRAGHLILTFTDGHMKDVALVVGKDGAPGLPGKDGASGVNGKDGTNGVNGHDGEPGIDGKNGTDGLNGKDGEPGLGFDDFDVVYDETRGFFLQLMQGGRVKEAPLPVPHHMGLWEPRTYPKAAMVTSRGSTFVALRQTNARPDKDDRPSSDWKLVAKRGQDGKDGKDGKNGDGL